MQQIVGESDLRAKSKALLESTLRNAGKAALAAALVPLAVASSTPAKAELNSRVTAKVTQVEGQYKYEFTVINTSIPGASGGIEVETSGAASGFGPERPWIVNWQLPLFNAEDISNIKAPAGWAFEIVAPAEEAEYYNNPESPYGKSSWAWSATSDPVLNSDDPENANAYGTNPGVYAKPPLIINWYSVVEPGDDGNMAPASPIGALDALKGFEFTSKYPAVGSPYVPRFFMQGENPSAPGKAVVPASPSYEKALEVQISSTQ